MKAKLSSRSGLTAFEMSLISVFRNVIAEIFHFLQFALILCREYIRKRIK